MEKRFFEILKKDKKTKSRIGVLHTPHGDIKTPAFLPYSATALARAANVKEIGFWGAQAIAVSTYHTLLSRGVQTKIKSEGIRGMLNWSGPVAATSGSPFFVSKTVGVLFGEHSRPKNIALSGGGILFQAGSERQVRLVTPENSINAQLFLKSDIIRALSPGGGGGSKSANFWIDWSKRARRAFDKATRGVSGNDKPVLFFPINLSLGKNSFLKQAAFLLENGAEGFYSESLSKSGKPAKMKRLEDLRALKDTLPFYLSSVSGFEDFLPAIASGVDLFDSLLPNEMAFRGKVFVRNDTRKGAAAVDIKKPVFKNDNSPLDSSCDCYFCLNYGRAELHAFFEDGDPAAYRFSSMHNLRFILGYFERIRRAIEYGGF